MKYLAAFVFMLGLTGEIKAQTFSCAADFTCYHLDSSNVHCYKEDSEADLDLDNDGVVDREYMFSTPQSNAPLNNKDLKKDHGVIRNRNSETWEDISQRDSRIDTIK